MKILDQFDPDVRQILQRAMVGRIATLSSSGKPSITPLYFVTVNGHCWLGTASWTLAAREAAHDARVSVLLNIERNAGDRRVLRLMGRADVRTDRPTVRAYNWRVALKYVLSPGAIRNFWQHRHLVGVRRSYYAQSATKGVACVIDVVPEQFEILT